jgi:hypothetical protein
MRNVAADLLQMLPGRSSRASDDVEDEQIDL